MDTKKTIEEQLDHSIEHLKKQYTESCQELGTTVFNMYDVDVTIILGAKVRVLEVIRDAHKRYVDGVDTKEDLIKILNARMQSALEAVVLKRGQHPVENVVTQEVANQWLNLWAGNTGYRDELTGGRIP